ncbi:hypothetical protein EJB05_28959 [Eragrostis curvula]|uniref:F-box domain-containing protein n=1 Tax=Eragrostis curvula TaxID=38414 RepID=A0A5J9URM4_9POAL|nr:hypothetical protein EJB05_28959 [Eragrostis curvula]
MGLPAVRIGARPVFDGMPPRRKGTEGAVLPGTGAAHIDALPDGVLHHILGFVDAREAVRTSVLAWRWRHLWKSATALRMFKDSLEGIPSFMEHLLLLRGGSPFDAFDLRFLFCEDSDVPHVNLWVRHALLCKVRELLLHTHFQFVPLDDLPIVSQHLRSLDLCCAVLKNSLCDFSGCPSLEQISIEYCAMPCAKKISSKSVKRLTIRSCSFNKNQGFRTHIYAPNLVSLVLDDKRSLDEPCRTPVLDSMPKLKDAFVRLAQKNADCCSHADESGNCGQVNCHSCYGIKHDNNCLLLEGLSEAENLKLIAESKTFVFQRDLKQCPTFRKLKTLFLNDYWCVAPDFLALSCILKHAPILEKLVLQLFAEGSKHKLRIKGSRNPMELSAATKHLKTLKTVEINCDVIDERIIKMMKFLSTFDIRKLTSSTLHGLHVLSV